MMPHTPALSSEFDLFASRPVQTSVAQTTEIIYKPIASVEQNVLKFLVPADNETYTDLNIKLFITGQLAKEDGSSFAATDHVGV
jgi:hypothetical protein